MLEVKEKLNKIKNQLKLSKKQKLLCISTTANINNPQIIFGPIRETRNTIAGNIILSDISPVDEITSFFDGFVDYFFIDSEIKNELKNLEENLISKIKKSKFLIYKPNDFTVESLDMFIACKERSLLNKNVLIIGGGNIGSKIALKLSERGASVQIYSKDYEELKKIVDGLNSFKRSSKNIIALEKKDNITENIDILLGCTPGIPAIDKEIINKTRKQSLVIDVGSHTIDKKAFDAIHKKDIKIHTLSSLSGYIGMIETWASTLKNLKNLKTKIIGDNVSLVSVGLLGNNGDIIVDNVDDITKIFGICDGFGDVLSWEKSKKYIETIDDKIYNKKTLQIIKKLFL